jgi:predicted HD superfamily hydrolase involved in NAD metabolism
MNDKEVFLKLEKMGEPYLAQYQKEYALVAAQLSAARMQHSLGVAATAAHLAEKYGGDPAKAYLAGLCHDAAKELPRDEMYRLVLLSKMADDEDVLANKVLWHAPAGSVWLAEHEREYPLLDAEIQSACLWHTLGKPGMTPLEEMVFVADLIEPGRDFPDLPRIRSAAEESLTAGVAACMYGAIHFLEVQNKFVHPLAYSGYEYYRGLLQNTEKQNTENM